MNIIRCY